MFLFEFLFEVSFINYSYYVFLLEVKMKNTKGQGMSTNTIILLILGVIILVILIMGFTVGWDKISPFISRSNVDDIGTSCQAACTTQSKYDFCSFPRELKDAEKNTIKTTCAVFSTEPSLSKYGINFCNLDCDLNCADIKIDGVAGSPISTSESSYDVSALAGDGDCFIN